MKKGKYMDYTCLMACLSHNKQSQSLISELIEQVKAGDKLNEKLLLSEATTNVRQEIVELSY